MITQVERPITSKQVVPWKSIWDSGIPAEIIQVTAGLCYKYETTYESVSSEKNRGVLLWRNRVIEDLMGYVNQTPQSIEVYRRLREACMIMPIQDIEDKIQ